MKLLRLALVFCCAISAQTLWGASILIYGPSMWDETPNERTIAEDAGHDVTVVDEVEWAAMDAGDFAEYDAIVFGDNHCEGTWSDFAAVNANKGVWSPVITGNVVIHTADPIYHFDPDEDNVAAAGAFVENGIYFAANGEGTGLYVSLGCYADGDGDGDVDYLSEIGPISYLDEEFDDVFIELTDHAVFEGLTDADMSNWGSTGHSLLESFPGSFEVAAIDDSSGEAIVIVRGALAVALPADVPALSPLAMALLAAALGAAALVALRMR